MIVIIVMILILLMTSVWKYLPDETAGKETKFSSNY